MGQRVKTSDEIYSKMSDYKQVAKKQEFRAEFMYDYYAFEGDRERVKKRFMEKMNSKTTLRELGEMLD